MEKSVRANLIVLHKVPLTRLTRPDTHYSHASVYYTCRYSRSSFFPYVAILRKGTDFVEEGMLLEKLQHPNIVGVEERSSCSNLHTVLRLKIAMQDLSSTWQASMAKVQCEQDLYEGSSA
jgi:hypothetical protein